MYDHYIFQSWLGNEIDPLNGEMNSTYLMFLHAETDSGGVKKYVVPEFVSALVKKGLHDRSFCAIYGVGDQSIIKPEDTFEVGLGVLAMVYQHFRKITRPKEIIPCKQDIELYLWKKNWTQS